MTFLRFLGSGSLLNGIIATRFFDGVMAPYSSDPDSAYEVCEGIKAKGFEMEFDETNVFTCSLRRDGKVHISEHGSSYEEAICLAAARMN